MASIEHRAGKVRVYWRNGGRGGTKESCTFGGPHAEAHAKQAKRIAEAHQHNIDRRSVYAAVLKLPQVAPAPVVTVKKTPTVREWSQTWLNTRTRISPGTKARYTAQLRNEILPRIGDLHLDEVDGASIANLLTDLRVGRKDSTVTRYYSLLHSMLGFAFRDRKIDDNPAKRTDFIRDLVAHDDPGQEEKVYLTGAEYALVFGAADPKAQPLIACLAETGARFSEAIALDVEDLLLFRTPPAVRITKAWKYDGAGRWYRGSTKGRERRTVPVTQRLVDILMPLVTDRPGTALLFTAPNGGRIHHSNFVNRFWAPAVAQAGRCDLHPPAGGAHPTPLAALVGPRCGDNGGERSQGKACRALVHPGWDRCVNHLGVPATATSTCECPTRMAKRPTPHDLRHSHVSWLIGAGRPLVAVSRRIGHHSVTITERTYTHILPSVDDETVAALDAMTDLEVAAAAPDLLAGGPPAQETEPIP